MQLAGQEVVDIADSHALAVLLILLLKLFDSHHVVVFLLDQVLHVQFAQPAGIIWGAVVILEELKRALKVLLVLELFFLDLLGGACTLQLHLLQLQHAFLFPDPVEKTVGWLSLGLNFRDVVPVYGPATLFVLLYTLLGLQEGVL